MFAKEAGRRVWRAQKKVLGVGGGSSRAEAIA